MNNVHVPNFFLENFLGKAFDGGLFCAINNPASTQGCMLAGKNGCCEDTVHRVRVVSWV